MTADHEAEDLALALRQAPLPGQGLKDQVTAAKVSELACGIKSGGLPPVQQRQSREVESRSGALAIVLSGHLNLLRQDAFAFSAAEEETIRRRRGAGPVRLRCRTRGCLRADT